ncbi:MAG TPA: ROK family protein [Pyrinomonadaceae bacterium]|jgi:glucokinase
MNYSIGIDLGGTNIKVAALAENKETLLRETCKTGTDLNFQWAETVRAQIRAVEDKLKGPPTAIGLASPGIVGPDTRRMAAVTGHLEGIQDFDWADFLDPVRPALLNDAHAALLGEVAQGAARGVENAVLITLGTGVGGAILAEGRLLKGNLGRAGHLGHICLDIDGAPDSNGIPGTLEAAIGNQTLAQRSNNLYSSTENLVAAHLAGDGNAGRVWLRSVYHLACAVTSLINVVDPEIVVIGGGIARAGDALFDPLRRYLEQMEWRALGYRVRIAPAQLGAFAGAVGAAFHALGENQTARGAS